MADSKFSMRLGAGLPSRIQRAFLLLFDTSRLKKARNFLPSSVDQTMTMSRRCQINGYVFIWPDRQDIAGCMSDEKVIPEYLGKKYFLHRVRLIL